LCSEAILRILVAMKQPLEKNWDWEISSETSNWSWDLKSLLSYRHLLASLVRKEFLLNYQQTILGPGWILVQPLLTLMTYVLVFGMLIRIPTGEGIPPVLFYLSGIVLWNFFNDSFGTTSRTFREYIHIFTKVYFPRIIIPLASISTQFMRFLVQLLLLVLILLYYIIFRGYVIQWSWSVIGIPLAIAGVGIISLGMGLIFSVLTAKYRDIVNIVEVSIRLLFFITPVVYPLASVREDLRWIVKLNPLTPLFELFRLGVLGQGTVHTNDLLYSFSLMLVTFVVAVYMFNKQGSKLIDVV
jgi:lipopolysaccharide transport system permease protein